MRLWNYTRQELCRRPGRTALTFAGIALGLAAVVALQLITDTVRVAYRELFETAGGPPALEVVATDLGGFDPDGAPGLGELPGVRVAVPRINGVVTVTGNAGRQAVPLLGIVAADPESPGACADGAFLDAGLAEALGLTAGQSFVVWAPGGCHRLRLTGITKTRLPEANTGGRLVVALPVAQEIMALPQRVNAVHVLLADGADRDRTREALARHLPSGLLVQQPGARTALADETLSATERVLTLLGWLAVTASIFVVLNTFLLNIGERRRELALLRALGATRGQVVRLLLTETLALAVAGSLAGCAAGVGLAFVLLGAVGRCLSIELPHLHLTLQPFALAPLVGVVCSLAATLFPTWHAAQQPPLTGLLPASQLPLRSGGWLPALPFGLCWSLAATQLMRKPARTASTVGILAAALALAVCFSQTLDGILAGLQHWYRQTIVADFLVYGSVPDTAFQLTTALPEDLEAEIGEAADAQAVDLLAFQPARANDTPVLVLARSIAPELPLPLDLQEGDEVAVRAGLLRGDVVLGTSLARKLGLHHGDSVILETRHGPKELRVAGIAAEYAAAGAALYVEWQAARQLFDLAGVHVFLVTAKPGSAAAGRLRDFCTRRHLLLKSNAELHALVDRSAAGAAASIWALVALVFVIAALGVVNTLTMNFAEQAPQFALLRALGLKRGQLCRFVLAQAAWLGGASLLPGVLGGLALAIGIDRFGAAGAPGMLRPNPLPLLVCCALALAVPLVAAIMPAVRTRTPALYAALRTA